MPQNTNTKYEFTRIQVYYYTLDYKEEVFYYELFGIVRKLILIGFLSLIPKQSIVQLYVGILIALLFGFNLAWTKPYRKPSMNFFATFADMFIVSFFTMMAFYGYNKSIQDPFFNESDIHYLLYILN